MLAGLMLHLEINNHLAVWFQLEHNVQPVHWFICDGLLNATAVHLIVWARGLGHLICTVPKWTGTIPSSN